MTMAKASITDLHKMVGAGEKALNKAAEDLSKKLATYGFRGTLSLNLKVAIMDKSTGGDDVVVERSTSQKLRD